MKRYTSELRLKAIIAVLDKVITRKEATVIFGCGSATLSRWLTEYKVHGKYDTNNSKGRPRLLSKLQEEVIKEYIDSCPDITTEELLEVTNFNVSSSTLDNYIKRLGYHYKKNSQSHGTRQKRHSDCT